MHILITGASGLIGKALVKTLIDKKYRITTVGRDKRKLVSLFGSKTHPFEWQELNQIKSMPDAIVHLAGHNIGNMLWTNKNMKLAFDSRVETAKMLKNWCNNHDLKPKIISASGVSYYGFYDDCSFICDEDSHPKITHKQFSQELAFACEKVFSDMDSVSLRFAPVFDRSAGVLAKLLLPVKLGGGAILGSGKQPFSWIELEDAVMAINFLLATKSSGPINITSPEVISQEQLMTELARQLERPLFLKAPSKLLTLCAGEFAEQFLVKGQAVRPKKLLDMGYTFICSSIGSCISRHIG